MSRDINIRFRGDAKELVKAADAGVKSLENLAAAAARSADIAQATDAKRAASARHSAEESVNALLRGVEREAQGQARREQAEITSRERAAAAARRAADQAVNAMLAGVEREEEAARRQAVAAEKAARAAASANEKAATTTGAGWRSAGMSVGGFIGQLAGVGSGLAVVNTAIGAFKGLSNAIQEASAHQARLADELNRQRETMAEIAVMQDKPTSTQFTLDQLRFGAETGLEGPKMTNFKKAFLGSGAQYEERIGSDQFKAYEKLVGQKTAAMGIDPKVMGELSGIVLGQKDWKGQYGNRAGEMAAAEFNRMVHTLMRGRGENAVLAGETAEAAGKMLSDKEMLSTFKSGSQLSEWISVMAQVSPGKSETFLREAVRGTQAFDDEKIGPLLKRAKVTRQDDFETRIKKLTPVLAGEAQAKGISLDETLGQYFSEREKGGMSAAIGQGILGGVLEERRKYGAQFATPEALRAQIAKARNDPESALSHAMMRAQAEYSRAAQGSETAEVREAFQSTEANMGPEINSTGATARQWLMRFHTPSRMIGLAPGEYSTTVYRRMLEDMRRRGGAAGFKDAGAFDRIGEMVGSNYWKYDSGSIDQAFQDVIGSARSQGINLTLPTDRGGAGGAGGGREGVEVLKGIHAELKGMRQAPANAPPPVAQPVRPAPGVQAAFH